jgi:squalene synthase HpnC
MIRDRRRPARAGLAVPRRGRLESARGRAPAENPDADGPGMPFLDDLRRFGPDASYTLATGEAEAYCADLTASHYENFSVVTRLTPKELRPAFAAVYAFCRWSDDLGDEVGDPARAAALLDWWRGELRAMYEGEARHPVFVALRPVVLEYGIPIGPFEALISAFRQDQVVTDYDTYAQLLDYCTRSADPVGHLVLYLARSHDPENARLSDCTCTGLQLANFWQDVSRDLDIPRIYLPREDRERFGYSDEDLHARRFTPAFRELLAYEVGRARALLLEGRELVHRMPRKIAIDVDLFNRGGLAILDRIEGQGFDVWSRRPEVGKLAKVGLLLRAMIARPGRSASRSPSRPLAESRG